MPEETTFQKRQIAYKVPISLILESNFSKDDLSAGFIQINEMRISRVNIIGTLVYISDQENAWSGSIDDGTGKINLRAFEHNSNFMKADVGDMVLVIGRIREFSNEKYIIPEIINKIENIGWFNLRKIEIEKSQYKNKNENNADEPTVDVKTAQNKDIYGIIKSLDSGDGAPIEDVILKSENKNAESIIKRLLENGDVFEAKPGKLKVLE